MDPLRWQKIAVYRRLHPRVFRSLRRAAQVMLPGPQRGSAAGRRDSAVPAAP